MTTDTFSKMWKADPFRPFRIHMANGKTHEVHHRDFVMMSPSGRTVSIYEGEGLGVLDLLLMTELEILTPAQEEAA